MKKYIASIICSPGSTSRIRTVLKLMGAENIRISESEIAPTNPKPKPDNLPTSPEARAVADLYGRKYETPWSEAEIEAFRKAARTGAITLDNMKVISAYYARERRKENHFCRRNLLTFLRYATGELDRARAAKPERAKALEWPAQSKIVPMPTLSDEARAAAVAELRRSREQMQGGGA